MNVCFIRFKHCFLGRNQAARCGDQLVGAGISKILCSPMIRTVISADIIAEKLGMGANSVNVEYGVVEEAKSFRGKTLPEPRPNWEPLVNPVSELCNFSERINRDYVPLKMVTHTKDESKPNTVAEDHETLTDRDEITKDRVRATLRMIIDSPDFADDKVLVVAHGATVKAAMFMFEEGLPDEMKIKGERNVSCFAEYRPLDPANHGGPWCPVTAEWMSGEMKVGQSAEVADDRG